MASLKFSSESAFSQTKDHDNDGESLMFLFLLLKKE